MRRRELGRSKKTISMPKQIEKNLKKQAEKKGLKGKRKGAYVFGTLNKLSKKYGIK